MPLYYTYETKITFSHKLEPRQEVVDKSCLDTHEHKDTPVVIGIKVTEHEWIDFKEIKQRIELIISDLYTGDLGVCDTESFVKSLASNVAEEFNRTTDEIFVQFRETQKYGVWWFPDMVNIEQ